MTDQPNQQLRSSRWPRWIGWLAWLAVLGCSLAIIVIRRTADTSDFAMANALTVLLSLAAWLLLTLAVFSSSLPRWLWLSVLLAPPLGLALFFSLYKFERFDGEMRPRFVSRWQTNPTDSTVSTVALDAPLWQPQTGDFPQYLGKNRDARLADLTINANWTEQPPRIAWKHPVGNGWSSFAVQGDAAITLEQHGDDEWVSAYNVLDGSLLWKTPMAGKHSNLLGGTGPRSTPTIADNRVYVASAVSRVACLELTSGQVVWSQELLELAGTDQIEFEKQVTWGRSASPLIVNEKVVVPLGGVGSTTASLIAFDRDSGRELWRSGSDQISYASPALVELAGIAQILYVSEKQLGGYSIDTGEMLWSTPWSGSSAGAATVSQPVVVDANHVLLSKGYGEGTRYLKIDFDGQAWDIETLWSKSASLRTKFTNCVVQDGFAYGLSDGILECVRLLDGERQWKRGRYRQGQLLLVGKQLLITAENGELVLVEATPDEHRELATFPVIGDVTWNPPALSGERLLMRNSDEMACVLLPLE